MVKIVFVLATVAIILGVNGMPSGSNRIVGGGTASSDQFPYMISLQLINRLPNQTLAHRCGGVMITFQHALTAAQCMYEIDINGTMTMYAPAAFRVFAGNVLLTNDNVAERIRTIASYNVHPEHLRYPALLNDIAIITLTTPFLNSTVIPLALPAANFIPQDETPCTVAGWGASSVAVPAANDALKYAIKYTYNQLQCTQLFSNLAYSTNIRPSMLCAASDDITSVGCYGDQGNALVCNGQLTGILSLTNQCIATSYPEVYTRVSNYTTWIRDTTGGATSFRPELALFAIAAVVYAAMFG